MDVPPTIRPPDLQMRGMFEKTPLPGTPTSQTWLAIGRLYLLT